MVAFNDPIVGGTVLIRPAIQSPNFSIAAKTGWAIMANGDAYFYDITAAGSVTAQSVVVSGSTGGVFIYSGTPELGNLIGSWAGTSGTDAEGNAYPAGLNVTEGAITGATIDGGTISGATIDGGTISGGTISGSTIEGSTIISSTILVYSSEGSGGLVASISPDGGVDAYGNTYPPAFGYQAFDGSTALAQVTDNLPFLQGLGKLPSQTTMNDNTFSDTAFTGLANAVNILQTHLQSFGYETPE